MTKKSRTILFYTFLFLFLLIAPISVLYSQGYRFDFTARQLVQTGGLYLRTDQRQAEIYINGKFETKTDFFSGSALISNLLPEKYNIKIEKAGFFPWEKTLPVVEKQVTEAKFLILFPENPTFSPFLSGINKYWLSPDGKKMILYENSSTTKNSWVLEVYDLETKNKSMLAKQGDFKIKNAFFLDLEFSETSGEINFRIGTSSKPYSFTLNYLFLPATATTTATSSTALPENAIAFKKYGSASYYLDKTGNFYRADSVFSPPEKLNDTPLAVKKNSSYDIKIFGNSIFISEDKNLYLLNADLRIFKLFYSDLKNLKLSPDGKKLLFFSKNEIWVLFLEDIHEQPQRKAGEKEFISRHTEGIGDVFWLSPDYLVFSTGNYVKITEIDDRDRLNVYDLKKFTNPEISWNQNDRKFYILSQGDLFSSESLVR
jgi:hypothetical protein